MKLSAYKQLLKESPRTAMIFDLTERFPRGPKAVLRPKHYEVIEHEHWRGNHREVKDDAFVGGENGYDLFELYELAKRSWWTNDLVQLTTHIEGAGMGRIHHARDDQGNNVPTGLRQVFKSGPQITRRLRTLESRLRAVQKIVESKSKANLYGMQVGQLAERVYLFADSTETAKIQYELMLKASFDSAAVRKAFHAGWGYREETGVTVEARFSGPSHGPHEIMEKNQTLSLALREANKKRREKIAELETAIEAADDLAQMVDMFTINTCAQTFEEKA